MPNWDAVITADGPAAWFKFNANYNDSVAGGTAGTGSGTGAYAPALTNDRTPNSALDYSAARLTIPAVAKTNLGRSFSFEILVQPDSIPPVGTRNFIQKPDAAGTYSTGVALVDGGFSFFVHNATQVWWCHSEIPVTTGRTFHVVATMDAVDLMSIYIDGELRGQTQVTGQGSTVYNGATSVGADWASAVYFDGKLDEFIHWNRPLEKREVEEHHLAARDNGTGELTRDRYSRQVLRDLPKSWIRCFAGSSIDVMGDGGFQLFNGAAISRGPADLGHLAYTLNPYLDALFLDGVNDYATIPASFKTDNGDTWGWSIQAWVRPTTVSGTRTILHRAGDWTLKLVAGVPQVSVTTLNGTFTAVATNPLAVDTNYRINVFWRHHTFWGSVLYLYVNGVRVGEIGTNGGMAAARTSVPVYVGALDGTSEFFGGQVAEVLFWDYAVGVQRLGSYFWMGVGLEDPRRRPYDATFDELVDLRTDPCFDVMRVNTLGRYSHVASWDSRYLIGVPGDNPATPNAPTTHAIYKWNADRHEDWDLQMYAFPTALTGTQTGKLYFHLNHDGEFAGSDPALGRNGYTLVIERLSSGTTQGRLLRYASYTETQLGATVDLGTTIWTLDPGMLIRFRKQKGVLSWKVWAAPQVPEKPEWDLVVTDAQPLPAGWWGFGCTNGDSAFRNYQFDYARVHGDRRQKSTIVGGVEKQLADSFVFFNSFGVATEFPLIETYPDAYPVPELPFVRASTSIASQLATVQVPKPTCLPGDVLFVVAASDDAAITGLGGTTWQEVYSGNIPQLSSNKVYRHVVEGLEPATFPMTLAAGCDSAAICFAVANVDNEQTSAAGWAVLSGSGTQMTAPGQDPLYDNGLLVNAFYMRTGDPAGTFTAPAGTSLTAALMDSWCSVAVATQPLPGTDTWGGTPFPDKVATRSIAGEWRGLSLVVKGKRPVVEPPVPRTGLVARWVARDLATVDGAAVVHNTWADRISGKLLATDRPDATARPTMAKRSLVNGRPAVRMDGVNDQLYTTGITGLGGSFGIIFRPASNTKAMQLVHLGGREFYMRANGTLATYVAGTGQLEVGGTAALSIAPHAAILSSGTTLTESIYLDGKFYANGQAGDPTANSGAFGIGTFATSAGRFFEGDIAEVFVWDHQVNIYEIMDFMRYAEAEYGVAL